MNNGKRFEDNFKKSVPKDVFYYRFKDGTASWDGANTRFQSFNICDCMIFSNKRLYLLELKSTMGKSLPLSRIRQSQLRELTETLVFEDVVAGLVINFSDTEDTFFLHIDKLVGFINRDERKSIPLTYLEEHGVRIENKKLKVNYKYKVGKFLGEV